MATINIDNFGGIAPRLHPTLLGEDMATLAHNCILKSGKLVPLRTPAPARIPILLQNGLSDIYDAGTIFAWTAKSGTKRLLAWPEKVYVAEGNLSNDERSRLFVTGETGVGGQSANHPCVIMDSGNGTVETHDLCKSVPPAPHPGDYDAATGTIIAHHAADAANARYTVFFQSWTDALGYESGISLPSEEVQYNDGDTIYMDRWNNPPQGAVSRRIYKSVSGAEETYVRFVAEQKKSASAGYFQVFPVRTADADAGENEPGIVSPHEDLSMVTKVPGNYYTGVRRSNLREVRFSEIGNPSNWPDEYTTPVYDDIIGLGITLNTVFTITKSRHWAISGSAPENMTASLLATDEGCVSADSICAHGGAVFYASANGICMLQDGAATARVITESAFSRREWQEKGPETCRMEGLNGVLFCWFAQSDPLAISLTGSADAAITSHTVLASATCVDRDVGKILFVTRG